MLAIGAGRLAALVTAATFVLYVFAYTPLKLRTPLCTLVGAVPGALPPVTGWAAARDDVAVGAWVLFGILFLWQLPHTLAIARLYHADYARAGVRLLPVIDAQDGSTERQILSGCVALLAVSLLPTLIGLAGGVYFVGALLLGATFAAFGVQQALAPSALRARRVLLASLLYLPVLLALLALRQGMSIVMSDLQERNRRVRRMHPHRGGRARGGLVPGGYPLVSPLTVDTPVEQTAAPAAPGRSSAATAAGRPR